MKIPNIRERRSRVEISLVRIVSEDSQHGAKGEQGVPKSSKDS